MAGKTVGYARVSAADQNLDRQLQALGEVDKLFTEKVSGKNTCDRPALARLIGYVREGDIVKVKSPDRLARSTTDLLALVEEMRAKQVQVVFVDNPELSTDTPQGEFMLTILAAVAQLERATTRERQAEGIAAARAKGVCQRTVRLSAERIGEARQHLETGVAHAKVARELAVSRTTLYEALNGAPTPTRAAPPQPEHPAKSARLDTQVLQRAGAIRGSARLPLSGRSEPMSLDRHEHAPCAPA